jgi:hypothetical protein
VLDFRGGAFGWDDEAPATSAFDAALHAEFPNEDRCLISRLRAARSG